MNALDADGPYCLIPTADMDDELREFVLEEIADMAERRGNPVPDNYLIVREGK